MMKATQWETTPLRTYRWDDASMPSLGRGMNAWTIVAFNAITNSRHSSSNGPITNVVVVGSRL